MSRRGSNQQPLNLMTPIEFVQKWTAGKRPERASAQEHFIDICAMIGSETPNQADPLGEWYAFEKGAQKTTGGKGFADVWKRGHFAWEYKGKHKSLDNAYGQLLLYREALENPPLLVVCDLDRFQIHTNFTNSIKRVHEFDLEMLRTHSLHPIQLLRAVFFDPMSLRPDQTPEQVTEEVATQFAMLAERLQRRGHEPVEVARFLNRLVFCFFAQNARLLPPKIINRILEGGNGDPVRTVGMLKELFGHMARKGGGTFGAEKIQWFNGGLFADDATLPLAKADLLILHGAAAVDWSNVEPAVLGTLFERAIDPEKRSQLGKFYTDKESILTVIEPVVMAPLRREFERMKGHVTRLVTRGKRATAAAKGKENPNRVFRAFLDRLRTLRVLDPACGSGNFLYLALRAIKDLEKEAIIWGATTMRWTQEFPHVGPQVVHGIEYNEYAAELARVSVWIGEIQWMLANGFSYLRDPVLRPLKTIEQRDAVLDCSGSDEPVEARWPEAEFIIGNPPFLGGKRLRSALGSDYVNALFRVYKGRVPAEADYVCYWFAKARESLASGRVKRVGLLATQGIRGGKNRVVLDEIKASGDIFLAWSDREWVLNGAEVHVSIVGFDDGTEQERTRDGKATTSINSDLTTGVDLTKAPTLAENAEIAFMGDTKGGLFEIEDEVARVLLRKRNPHGKPNSDVVVPWVAGMHATRRPKPMWIIDFGVDMEKKEAALYEAPFEYVNKHVRPERIKNARDVYAERWWIHVEPRPAMRRKLAGLSRFICTVCHAKHRIFFWAPQGSLPNNALIVFARADDYSFGLLQSRVHTVWSLAKGTQVREKETGFRYTPTSTFETFAFPRPTREQIEVISKAAERLNRLRENRLAKASKEDEELSLTDLYTSNPLWLQDAHAELDRAVLAAYGWPESITDEQVLVRLLALGMQRAEEHRAAEASVTPIAATGPRRPARPSSGPLAGTNRAAKRDRKG